VEHFFIEYSDPDSRARAGRLILKHGTVQTPVFMPVGTAGTVKALTSQQLQEIGFDLILSNTYHIFLRPGTELIKKYQGLHNFMAYQGSILTDSGGFQIYSLSKFIRIQNEGIRFKSHIDGEEFFLSPEDVINIQEIIGSDIMMPLDHCIPYDSSEKTLVESVERTSLWAERSVKARRSENLLFGIVQGGFSEGFRKKSAQEISSLALDGYAIGGVSVGEPQEMMYHVIEMTQAMLPLEKPRYVMGIGLPQDIVFSVMQGIDMFDCVIPTRHARNGYLFTPEGKLLIKNARYRDDTRPVEEGCPCPACSHYTRAYLRHLYICKELLYHILASLHNITFYKRLMDSIRQHIISGTLTDYYRQVKEHDY